MVCLFYFIFVCDIGQVDYQFGDVVWCFFGSVYQVGDFVEYYQCLLIGIQCLLLCGWMCCYVRYDDVFVDYQVIGLGCSVWFWYVGVFYMMYDGFMGGVVYVVCIGVLVVVSFFLCVSWVLVSLCR